MRGVEGNRSQGARERIPHQDERKHHSDKGGEPLADTWPFTGRKTELLEGGLRISAVISWPARIRQGHTTDQVAIRMDWLPTLLAAAGTARPIRPSLATV